MAGSSSKPSGGSAKAFNCGNCGGAVNIMAKGKTVVVACTHCGSLIDATDENYRIIQKATGALEYNPYIPIGTKGKLFGEKWACIGMMVRSDKTGVYQWREYLLYNPFKGFRWLHEFDGHWNFIKTLKKGARQLSKKASYAGQNYDLFHNGGAIVRFVLGEFYWRVRKNDHAKVMDYIAPPYMLSLEDGKGERVWSHCKYVEAEVIRKAFGIKDPIPTQFGIAPNQPSDYEEKMSGVIGQFLIFAAVILAAFVVSSVRSSGSRIYSGSFLHNPPAANANMSIAKSVPSTTSFVSEPFEIKGSNNNIEYSLSAAVRNNWLSTDVILHNLDTESKVQFQTGVEYYRGYSWAEGSTTKSIIVPDVPPGRYELNIKAYSLNNRSYFKRTKGRQELRDPITVRVLVRRGIVQTSNLVISLILLALPVGLIMFRKRNFEVRRWSTSDYSPYWSEDSY